MISGFGVELGEGDAGTQRREGTCDGQNTQGLTGTSVQAEGHKGGSAPSRETAADASMWRGVHM